MDGSWRPVNDVRRRRRRWRRSADLLGPLVIGRTGRTFTDRPIRRAGLLLLWHEAAGHFRFLSSAAAVRYVPNSLKHETVADTCSLRLAEVTHFGNAAKPKKPEKPKTLSESQRDVNATLSSTPTCLLVTWYPVLYRVAPPNPTGPTHRPSTTTNGAAGDRAGTRAHTHRLRSPTGPAHHSEGWRRAKRGGGRGGGGSERVERFLELTGRRSHSVLLLVAFFCMQWMACCGMKRIFVHFQTNSSPVLIGSKLKRLNVAPQIYIFRRVQFWKTNQRWNCERGSDLWGAQCQTDVQFPPVEPATVSCWCTVATDGGADGHVVM